MAKAAKQETKAQKEAEAARSALKKAKEAFEKKDDATTKAALAKAKEVAAAAIKAENRERFLDVGRSRTIKARAAIRRLINVASKKSYDYTADEAAKIIAGLKEATKEVETAFTATGTKDEAGDDFNFG